MTVVAAPAGSLMTRVMQGQTAVTRLADGQTFREAVDRLVDAVRDSGYMPVVPASERAAALLGGAMHADSSVRQATVDSEGRLPNKVLVIEAAAVSGLELRRTIEFARSAGADWIAEWIWRADGERLTTSADASQIAGIL